MQDGRMWLTLCTALSCWISWQGTWPMLCWVSWQRTSLYRSVSCCTASRTHSSHCLSRQESLRNKSRQTGRGKEDREIRGRKTQGQIDLLSPWDDKQNASRVKENVKEKLPWDPYEQHKRYETRGDRVRETAAAARGQHVSLCHEREIASQ